MIYWPRNVLSDPREVPELRRGLVELAEPGGVWHQAERARLQSLTLPNDPDYTAWMGDRGVEGASRSMMEWSTHALTNAQLGHVSEDLCEVLFSAHDSMPLDRVLDPADMATLHGFFVFAKPFIGHDSGSSMSIRVDAILWGPVVLPGNIRALGLGAFRWMDPVHQDDHAARSMREHLEQSGTPPDTGSWIPLGRSDWVVGGEIGAPTHDGISQGSAIHESMVEDRKLIAALWALLAEKRIVERTTVQATRPARRRLARMGDTGSTEVEVVHLRRKEYLPHSGAQGAAARTIGVRFAVRPHWRNQACGPNRSMRKLILVPPHIKGPNDAPFKHVERVWSLDQ